MENSSLVPSSAGDVGLAVVRKAIEEHVPENQAPTVLFEALSELPEGEDIPRTLTALTDFVVGPLSKCLSDKLGPEKGAEAVEGVKAALQAAAFGVAPAPRAPNIEIDVDVHVEAEAKVERSDSDWPEVMVDDVDPGRVSDPGGRPTMVMAGEDNVGEPVRVLVIARTARLAQRIRAAFGGHLVKVAFTGQIEECDELLETFTPSIVIVDGQNAADMPAGEVAPLLINAPEAALIVVWASDQPWGSAAVASLKSAGATFAPVPRSAGVEPMLDYVRARFSVAPTST